MTRQPDIRPYRGKRPEIAATAYIDPAAVIIGDVVIGADSSVWPCTVIRGDVAPITIGSRVNVQDQAVIHCDTGVPNIIEDDVVIGHSAIVHGKFVGRGSLIGMAARFIHMTFDAALSSQR